MAKPIQTDRFVMHCEVQSADVGRLYAHLTKMGFENVSFELVTDVRRFTTNAKAVSGVSGKEFAKQWLDAHPSFDVSELVEFFVQDGRSKAAAHKVAGELVASGICIREGLGHYRRVGAEPKPRNEPPGRGGPRTRRQVSNADAISGFIQGRDEFTTKELIASLGDGRTYSGVTSALSKLAKNKLVKNIATGRYVVTAKGHRVPTTSTNGTGQEIQNG